MIIGRIKDAPVTEEIALLLLIRDRVYATINEATHKFHGLDLLQANYYRPLNRAERREAKRLRRTK